MLALVTAIAVEHASDEVLPWSTAWPAYGSLLAALAPSFIASWFAMRFLRAVESRRVSARLAFWRPRLPLGTLVFHALFVVACFAVLLAPGFLADSQEPGFEANFQEPDVEANFRKDVLVLILAGGSLSLLAFIPAGFVLIATAQVHPRRGVDAFISYATQDVKHAREVQQLLEREGASTFIAALDLEPGKNWSAELRTQLVSCDELITIVTPEALTSRWVQNEAAAAWALDKRNTPLLVDVSPEELPPFLKERQSIPIAPRAELEAFARALAARTRKGLLRPSGDEG